MKVKVFAVLDLKVSAYMSPFTSGHAAQAVRSFEAACKDSNSQFSKHPEDFVLCEIAEFDDSTAQFVNHKSPVHLCAAYDFVAREHQALKSKISSLEAQSAENQRILDSRL